VVQSRTSYRGRGRGIDDLLGDDMSGQPVTGSLYSNISANGSGTFKAAPGSLFTITINQKGASSNLLTLYDNIVAAGTIIATIDTTSAVGTLELMVDFKTGLSYNLATGTAANITASFS
jgi:hypothetical protein